MKEIIIKDSNKIIRIDSLYDKNGNKLISCPATQEKCNFIYDNISHAIINKSVENPYLNMINAFSTYWIISDEIFIFLNEYKDLISNLKFKEIKLFDKNENIINGKYYIVLPNLIINKDDAENHSGLFYINEVFDNKDYLRTMYLNYKDFDPEFYSLKLVANGVFEDILKKQRIKGIELFAEKKEKNPIWFISNKETVKERLEEWLQELSKDKFLKSKCKYIYFTIIEERNGFNLSVAGYKNKNFNEETYTFTKDYCDLQNTELNQMNSNDTLMYLQKILNEIYKKYNYDFMQLDTYIGFHDGEILKISYIQRYCMSNVERKINDNTFLYQKPWFYNNKLSLRCELGIGKETVYLENAVNRALDILNILFKGDIIDCVFLDEYTIEDDINDNVIFVNDEVDQPDINEYFNFDKTIDLNITNNNNELYENVVSLKRHFTYNIDKTKIETIITKQILNEAHVYHFVSFKNNFIYSIYDDRGCDIVFFDEEKYKEFYFKLEKYFLDYDRESMKNTLDSLL